MRPTITVYSCCANSVRRSAELWTACALPDYPQAPTELQLRRPVGVEGRRAARRIAAPRLSGCTRSALGEPGPGKGKPTPYAAAVFRRALGAGRLSVARVLPGIQHPGPRSVYLLGFVTAPCRIAGSTSSSPAATVYRRA